jgi:hypothetical protein
VHDEHNKLGDVYTFDEVAAKFRIGRGSLADLIRHHPHYSKKGRVYRFSEADVFAIWEGMRCASNEAIGRLASRAAQAAKLPRSSNLQKLLTRRPRKISR